MNYIDKLLAIEKKTKVDDQTRIPQIEDKEVQAIRGILNDQKNKIVDLEIKISNARNALG